MANIPMKDIQFPGLDDNYTFAQIDNTLTQTGQAADAKKTGDEITELKADFADIETELETKADKSEALGSYVVNTASGAVASFDDGADDVPVKNLVAQIAPRQLGSGDPSPDNVREIVGWTGTGVHRAGVNLLGGELLVKNAKKYIPGSSINTDEKYIAFTGGSTATYATPRGFLGFFECKENTVYTIIYAISKSTGSGSNMRVNYTDGTYTALPGLTDVTQKETNVFVTDPNKTVLSISKSNMSGTTRLYYDEFGLFEGVHTIEEFVPYAGQTVDVDWSDEAGTVYGGTLDVTSGVLTLTKQILTLDGTESWSMYAEGVYFNDSAILQDAGYSISSENDWICNKYIVANSITNSSEIGSIADKTTFNQKGTSTSRRYYRIWVKDESFTTLESFTASLASTPIQLVYTIPTSQTYQLTPAEVTTLLGQNSIWCDCNYEGSLSVGYRADTKLYIEKLTAPTEDDMVANTTIPDATYFMIGNNLYLSTTTIPAGDAINPGTNCTLMNLASALNALNS